MYAQYFRFAIFALIIGIQAGMTPSTWGQTIIHKSTPVQDKRVPAGQIQEVEVDVTSGSLQWQQSDDGINWADWAGRVENRVSVSVDREIYLRCAIQESRCDAVYSDIVRLIPIYLPELTTRTLTDIQTATATSGGIILSDGNDPVIGKGVCWSTAQNPDISGNNTQDGSGSGDFFSMLTGLNPGTVYFVRAYATNGVGTAYGNELTFNTPVVAAIPTVTTAAVTSITHNSVVTGGNVTSEGSAPVVLRGVCWSTLPNPTRDDIITADGTGPGPYTSTINTLVPNFTYHVRAFATNSVGTAYGEDVTFTTLINATYPTVITLIVSSITQTSAMSGGNVTAQGSSAVIARGVCWSSSTNPTIDDSKTTNGTGTGAFPGSITGLSDNTTYYVRAFATNSEGTAYGAERTFKTLIAPAIPTVTTAAVTSITQNSVVTGGNVTSEGSAPVVLRGVCWSNLPNPTRDDIITADGTGPGPFTSTITDLAANFTYHVRAFASNSVGTAYGEDVTFTTLGNNSVPVLTTLVITNVDQSSASSGGMISSQGSSAVTARGVCYGTSRNPGIRDDHTSNGSGSGNFKSEISGLESGTRYYVRAYATNSTGTGYGDELSFNTRASSLPVLTTTEATDITPLGAKSGGNITSQGSSAVTERGVCYSTATDPTIAGSHITSGSGTGSYISILGHLTSGRVYYVRAYATNGSGTAYGNQITFTTLGVPTVSTSAATNVEPWSATVGGNVTAQGSSAVTARGVCWGTSSNPDLTGTFTSDGSGLGAFTASLPDLNQNTTYYIRAYATNAVGTDYGSQLTFITGIETVKDGSDNIYNTVKIGTQIWITENLKTTKYTNGSNMTEITGIADWAAAAGKPAMCWANNNVVNKNIFGALYNWEAVRSGKLEPAGWHVPTKEEVETLIRYLGGALVAGGKLKETGTTYWGSPNTGATNESGFSARGGGYRLETGVFATSSPNYAYFWTSTQSGTDAWMFNVHYASTQTNVSTVPATQGLSIRLIKD